MHKPFKYPFHKNMTRIRSSLGKHITRQNVEQFQTYIFKMFLNITDFHCTNDNILLPLPGEHEISFSD